MPVRSVREGIEAYAKANRIPAAAIAQARLDEHLDASLPPRYRRLAAEVFLRLPDGWDSHAHWTMSACEIASEGDVYLAGAHRVKGDWLQLWEIKLVPRALDRYSDAAVRWVIAHECAHVATGLSTDPRERDADLYEDRADHLASFYGFEEDHEAYEKEAPNHLDD